MATIAAGNLDIVLLEGTPFVISPSLTKDIQGGFITNYGRYVRLQKNPNNENELLVTVKRFIKVKQYQVKQGSVDLKGALHTLSLAINNLTTLQSTTPDSDDIFALKSTIAVIANDHKFANFFNSQSFVEPKVTASAEKVQIFTTMQQRINEVVDSCKNLVEQAETVREPIEEGDAYVVLITASQ